MGLVIKSIINYTLSYIIATQVNPKSPRSSE